MVKITSGVGSGGLPGGETLCAELSVLFLVRWQWYLMKDTYVERSRYRSLNVKSTPKEKVKYSSTRHGNDFYAVGFLRESVRRCRVGNRKLLGNRNQYYICSFTNLRQWPIIIFLTTHARTLEIAVLSGNEPQFYSFLVNQAHCHKSGCRSLSYSLCARDSFTERISMTLCRIIFPHSRKVHRLIQPLCSLRQSGKLKTND